MGSTSERVRELAKVPILSFMAEDELSHLAEAVTERPFQQGDVLLKEGAFGAEVYVIISGDCDVVRSGAVIAAVGRHQMVGEMAVLDPERRAASVIARTAGLAYVLTGFNFRAALQASPKLALQLIKGLTVRLRKADAENEALRTELARLRDG
jgi:CRP-like cAMP-binding protein